MARQAHLTQTVVFTHHSGQLLEHECASLMSPLCVLSGASKSARPVNDSWGFLALFLPQWDKCQSLKRRVKGARFGSVDPARRSMAAAPLSLLVRPTLNFFLSAKNRDENFLMCLFAHLLVVCFLQTASCSAQTPFDTWAWCFYKRPEESVLCGR